MSTDTQVFMPKIKSGDQMVSRWGVKFTPTEEENTYVPTLVWLQFYSNGLPYWENHLQADTQRLKDAAEMEVVADILLNTFVKKLSRTKRREVEIGDMVYHTDSQISGKLDAWVGDSQARLIVNGFAFTLNKKGLVKDRNSR